MPPAPQYLYLELTQKAADATGRRITGIASTPTPDRRGDIIEPRGLRFTNPVPLLLHHEQDKPIGLARLGTPTATGLPFEADFPVIADPGPLRDRVEGTLQAIRAGLYTAVSVAINRLTAVVKPLPSGALHFLEAEVVELSIVTVPANREASILSVKALDAPYLAKPVSLGGPKPMTITDQLAALETRKSNARTRMDAILDRAQTEERTLTVEESTEHDALANEYKRLDEDEVRWKERELVNKSLATPIGGGPGPSTPPLGRSAVPPPAAITVKSLLQPAASFTRLAMALMYGKGNRERSIEYAKQWKDTPEVETILKAAVTVGTTTDATWAGPLVPTLQTVANEFLALLRPAMIIGRVPGLVNVPFNVRVAAQTGGGTYGWVGEGLSKPVTKLAFSAVSVAMHKAAGIIVFTEELARISTPRVEEVVRRDMIAGISQFLDGQFIDPAVAEVTGVNPASITNGLTPHTSADDFLTDLGTIFDAFAAAGIDPTGMSLLMSPANAMRLALTRENGIFVFPNVSTAGGTVVGVNVVTSTALGSNVIAIARDCVFIADDGGIEIDVSREASVQMDSAPATPPTPMVSLWQQNLVGLRADRFISWKRARAAGVQLVTGADYTQVAPAGAAARATTAKRSAPPAA